MLSFYSQTINESSHSISRHEVVNNKFVKV